VIRRAGRKLGSLTLRLRNSFSHIVAVLVTAVALIGCDPTKRVPQGEHLLKANAVIADEPEVSTEELVGILKQKPNKRILGIPFYLWLYNVRDPEVIQAKRMVKDSLCAERNLRRAAKGRNTKRCDKATRERNSEPPVILDSALTERSRAQIRSYLQKEGWFRAEVKDTVHYHRRTLWARLPGRFSSSRGKPYRRPKAEVAYHVTAGPQYTLRNIRFEVDDPAIRSYVERSWGASELKTGSRYDADVLDAERQRITTDLNELGYLYFHKDLITFVADTSVGEHQVDLRLRMERPFAAHDRGLQGTPEGTVYTIRNVTIQTGRATDAAWDSTHVQDYLLLHHGRLMYRPRPLLGSMFLLPNNRYKLSDANNTYSRLTALRVFDRVEVAYDTTGTGRPGLADVRIGLLPGEPQSIITEVYGTNRGGFIGTTLSFGYKHRNVLRTLGFFQGQINFAVETQQAFTRGVSAANTGLGSGDLFNTVSIGPEITIGLPRPFRWFSKSSGSRMTLNLLYNFQRRPDFTRTLARGSFGFDWNSTPTQHVDVRIPELSVIRIPSKSDEFNAFLQQTNDPVFVNSYTDHLILSIPKITYTWNTQGQKNTRTVKFLRSTFESAGSLLHTFNLREGLDTITDREFETLFGVRYAEFLKFDNDFRINRRLHDRSSIAFRVAAGIGAPFSNLEVLPFESAFFGGGANGLRAWQARSLGPGSYSAPLFAFDRVGEIRLEANFEYRFKLIGYLEGALFTDVGNIWNRRKDPVRPGVEFDVNDFLSELAVGTGAGARLNFEFFIIRFDLGMQTKDPSLPVGERWLFQPKDRYITEQAALGNEVAYRTRFNFNLGIGYPF
jgi:outer membrane protein assembly factor BamA